MKVILKEYVDKLGNIGDIVNVKPGYARNYLLPKGLALEINKHNLEIMKIKKQKEEKKLKLERLNAEEQKKKIESFTITIYKKAGENDVLFGSVTTSEIEEKLNELGANIEKKKIHLDEPIKRLGNYTCKIKLLQDLEAELKIEVLKQETSEE